MKYPTILSIFAPFAVGALASTVAQIQTDITNVNSAAQSFASAVNAVTGSLGAFTDVLVSPCLSSISSRCIFSDSRLSPRPWPILHPL